MIQSNGWKDVKFYTYFSFSVGASIISLPLFTSPISNPNAPILDLCDNSICLMILAARKLP
jgi:hypothetical protein